MKFMKKSLLKNEKGQAMVEFALMLPVLLLILCGIVEIGWLFTNQLMITNVSREAARYGVIYSRNANQLELVNDKIYSLIPGHIADKVDTEVAYSNPIAPRTGDIIVKVFYYAEPLTPITGIFVNDSITLSAKCVMKLE